MGNLNRDYDMLGGDEFEIFYKTTTQPSFAFCVLRSEP